MCALQNGCCFPSAFRENLPCAFPHNLIVSEGHESWNSLAGYSSSGSLVQSQTIAWGCSHSRGLQDQLPTSLTWLLAGGFTSSSHGPLHGASHNMAAGFSQSKGSRRQRGDVTLPFMTYSLSHTVISTLSC